MAELKPYRDFEFATDSALTFEVQKDIFALIKVKLTDGEYPIFWSCRVKGGLPDLQEFVSKTVGVCSDLFKIPQFATVTAETAEVIADAISSSGTIESAIFASTIALGIP